MAVLSSYQPKPAYFPLYQQITKHNPSDDWPLSCYAIGGHSGTEFSRIFDIFVASPSINIKINMNQGQTVHLADDDEDDRRLIKDALEEINPKINVIEAENGEELVDNVKKSDDLTDTLVMVDMNMPKKNGIEAIQEIRSEPELAEIPTIMFSTSNSPELKRKAFDAGASDFIVKPNSFGGLLEILKGVLMRFLGRK